MKVGKVCEYKKQKKGKISCTVMVRIKMDVKIQLILKWNSRRAYAQNNWVLGLYPLL